MSSGERAATRIARGLLVALAAVLPFEVPLFGLGPLHFTTVELVLYALLAAWGVTCLARVTRDPSAVGRAAAALRSDSLARSIIAWGVVVLLAALVAPLYRGPALKFFLRSLSGILVFFAARDLAGPPGVARRVLAALLGGAAVSAIAAVVDSLVPSSAPLWALFGAGQFTTLGLARSRGVFEYPTIGAMYWEASVPLVVTAAALLPRAWIPRRLRSSGDVAAACAASGLLVWAILASATRSGLAGAAIGCGALLAMSWRSRRRERRIALAVLGVIAALSALVLTGSASMLGNRLRWWQDAQWLRAEYVLGKAPSRVPPGAPFAVPVLLRNTGTLIWPHDGPKPVRLAYHWERRDGSIRTTEFEGARTPLPADVPPGGSVQVLAEASAPASLGRYRLQWDLVQENVGWFGDLGEKPPPDDVEVAYPAASAHGTRPRLPEQDANDAIVPRVPPAPAPRPALWRAALVLWRDRPLLGIGPDNFRRRYEAILSPSPTGAPYTDTRIHANSLYFETLADMGTAGVVALGGLVFALFRLARRQWAGGSLLGLGCAVSAGLFFVHGLFDYFFEFTPLFGLFWILVGLSGAADRPAFASEGLPSSPP